MLGGALVLLLVQLTAAQANACINASLGELSTLVSDIREVEERLAAGDPSSLQTAVEVLSRAELVDDWETVFLEYEGSSEEQLGTYARRYWRRRGLARTDEEQRDFRGAITDALEVLRPHRRRLHVIVSVRSGGREPPTGWRDVEPTAEHRRQHLWDAAQLLEAELRRDPQRPLLRMVLGEALARLPKRRDEGLRLLQDLHQQDLMPGPHGYAALAALQQAAGEESGAREARLLCSQRTLPELSATVCRFPLATEKLVAEGRNAPEGQ